MNVSEMVRILKSKGYLVIPNPEFQEEEWESWKDNQSQLNGSELYDLREILKTKAQREIDIQQMDIEEKRPVPPEPERPERPKMKV